MNKRKRSAEYMSKHASILKCPICGSSMGVHDLGSVVCHRRHTFDIAKQGYLNLMTHPIKTNYDKALFEARRKVIIDSDFFKPFHTEMITMIHKHTVSKGYLTVVDMGSGEGSHMYQISHGLQTNGDQTVMGIGLDISKEGILEAAKHYENNLWLVADLAHTPLNDHTVDVMLNILSPSNYEEFNRLLKDDGIIIKIVPGKNYLKELRQYFYGETEHKDYSNEKVTDLFQRNFNMIDQSTINYTSVLDEFSLQSLVKMTPLTWGISESDLGKFLESGIREVTVDLEIMVGRKKGE